MKPAKWASLLSLARSFVTFSRCLAGRSSCEVQLSRVYKGTWKYALIRRAFLRRFIELTSRHADPSLFHAFWLSPSINACFRVA